MITLYDIDIFTWRISMPPSRTIRRVKLRGGDSFYATRELTPEEKARQAREDYNGGIDNTLAVMDRVVAISFLPAGSIHIEGLMTQGDTYSWTLWVCYPVALTEEVLP